MDQEILRVFFNNVRFAVVIAFLRLERSLLRWWSDATRLVTSFCRYNPMWFLSMGLRQESGLCSSSSHKYPGTEGTNQIRHWNHPRWHATKSLERTGLSCFFCRITKGAHI